MREGELTLHSDGPIVYAAFRGQIDLSNVNELRQAVSSGTPNDAVGLVLDLSEVEYLDSSGLRFIHRLREDLRIGGQRLQLVVPEGSVILDVLRLAGLDWSGAIAQSVEDGRRMLELDGPSLDRGGAAL